MNEMKIAAVALLGAGSLAAGAHAAPDPAKPTVVLVHGAFADASGWGGVISKLSEDGYPVMALANPLRSVESDADQVRAILATVPGPVVLVGHSYGGAVISAAADGQPNVKALVYVAAFEPAPGETSLALSEKFPGSTLGPALAPPVKLKGGGVDLYIQRDRFAAQFAADAPPTQAAIMAATQRPIAQAALTELQVRAAWRSIPSWSIYGGADLNIPPAALAFMSKRANARRVVEIPGASHALMVSHPAQVAALIEEAAQQTSR